MKPMWRARQAASARSDRPLTSVPPIRMTPRVGRSMPASRLSSVDLPEPDGPMRPRKSPSSTVIDTFSSTGISIASRLYDLVTSRSSISGMRLRPLYSYDPALGQRRRRIHDHRFARHYPGAHLDLIDPVGAERHRAA